jgi:hypothetical protein
MEMMDAEACNKSRYRSLRFRGEGQCPTATQVGKSSNAPNHETKLLLL